MHFRKIFFIAAVEVHTAAVRVVIKIVNIIIADVKIIEAAKSLFSEIAVGKTFTSLPEAALSLQSADRSAKQKMIGKTFLIHKLLLTLIFYYLYYTVCSADAHPGSSQPDEYMTLHRSADPESNQHRMNCHFYFGRTFVFHVRVQT